MHYIKEFIEANRQTGTTTALVKAVRETNGYLITGNYEMKWKLLKQYPDIKERILALSDLESYHWKGSPKGPVFFDTEAIPYRQTSTDCYKPASKALDGYSITTDGYKDGYSLNTRQINVKLTEDDVKDVNDINKSFFENEASNSMIGRILLRKGIAFYKKLMDQ